MRKYFISVFAIALSFAAFAQSNNTMVIHQGNAVHDFSTQSVDSIVLYRLPGEGIPPISIVTTIISGTDTLMITKTIQLDTTTAQLLLGIAGFASKTTWTVGSQTWSDAVQTTICSEKKNFKSSNYEADCRSNPGQKGDLFSWEMVNQYGTYLCPDPWRVPTKEDFIKLDIALGGTGENKQGESTLLNKYLNSWGGTHGGYCRSGGTLYNQGTHACYWSQSEHGKAGNGYNLHFHSSRNINPNLSANINPQFFIFKGNGFSLRCVQ